MAHKCPTCKKTIKTASHKSSELSKFFPFCSQRCKLIDLGDWLDAKYRIPAETESSQTAELPDTSSTDNTRKNSPAEK